MTVREYNKSLKGEISVFLSLIAVLLISFILAILDCAVIKTYGNRKKIDTNTAVFSVFGEYQDELFNDYGIFSVDSSYGKSNITEEYIEDKLRYYGTGDVDHTVEGILLLTDENCAAFRSQAIKYLSGPLYDDKISSLEGNESLWQQIIDSAKEAFEEDGEYDSLLEELKGSYTEESEAQENAFEILEDSKNSSLLDKMLPNGTEVSERRIDTSGLVSKRELRSGRGVTVDTSKIYTASSKLIFNEYVLQMYRNMTDVKDEDPGLLYETEYILNGKDSDRKNLEETLKKLIFIRVVPNYEHILNSPSKTAEIEALSNTLSVAIGNPELAGVISKLLKWLWAYTESKCDVSALMAGLKVPETKTDVTWNSGLYDCFTDNITYNLEGCESGLDYKGYLRILLFAGKQEKITVRCVDMAELDICSKRENFRADNCFVGLRTINRAELLKGFTYTFSTEFSYD